MVKESKKIIHTTQVKVDLERLRGVVEELKANYLKVNTRETHTGRSLFSKYNNIAHFYERCRTGAYGETDGKFTVLTVTGAVDGNTARVYYTPSVTSLAKEVRKAIVPLKEGNVFAYFDIRAAEFALNCMFCDEREALVVYQQGGDIYSHYAGIFPAGTERKVYKTCLIGWLYGISAYRVAKNCGITETRAQRILDCIDRNCGNMAKAKIRRIWTARRAGCYLSPDKFDQNQLIKVGEIDTDKGFQPLLALSAWVQSALGRIMQGYIGTLQGRTRGTLLTVFDSMFVEINPASLARYQEFVTKMIKPFMADDVRTGKTMFEAAYGE